MIFLEIWIIENTFNINDLFIILTALSSALTAGGIGWSVRKYFKTKNNEQKNAEKYLLKELEDGLIAIGKNSPFEITQNHGFKNDIIYRLTNAFLNHDIYDSLVMSGKITNIDLNCQQTIQDIFQKIKQHNEYYNKILEIEDNYLQKDEIEKSRQITEKYYKINHDIENSLLKDIPIIIDQFNHK